MFHSCCLQGELPAGSADGQQIPVGGSIKLDHLGPTIGTPLFIQNFERATCRRAHARKLWYQWHRRVSSARVDCAVSEDGQIKRIQNWDKLTKSEQDTAWRRIQKRNTVRSCS